MYLIRRIDRQGWDSTILNRRIQEYGYKYDYFARQITNKLTPLPPCAITLCQMLLEKKVIQDMPNQLIINEYKHNQGFSKHVDSWDFDPVIFTFLLALLVQSFFGKIKRYTVLNSCPEHFLNWSKKHDTVGVMKFLPWKEKSIL